MGSAPPEIQRTQFLQTIELLFEGPFRIVVVEGPDGMGKTTLLRQFVEVHRHRSVSLFLSGASRWAYNPWHLARELHDQVMGLLGEDLTPSDDLARPDLSRAFSGLYRAIRQEGEPYYFVLDGIEDLPESERGTATQIIELLPIGMHDRFRFLLSSHSARDLPIRPTAKALVRGYPLSLFGAEEAQRYLEGVGLSSDELNEIIRTTRGLPGNLASVRRLLQSGVKPATLIANLPSELPELFELEWRSVDVSDAQQLFLLGMVAHELRSFSVAELSEIAGYDVETTRTKLSTVPFVEIGTDDLVRFPSHVTKRFLAQRLEDQRQPVHEALIRHFSRDPDSDEALANLPKYLSSAERLQDLVEYLSPHRFAELYKKSPSLKLVREHADRGIEAAQKLGHQDDLLRFMLQGATIEEVSSSRVAVAEVRARAAVNDFDQALALAEAEPKLASRLYLLAAIARVRKEQGCQEDPDLASRIHETYEQLGDEPWEGPLSDVAIELFHTSPELAIDLVSRPSGDGGSQDMGDWAITSLLIEARLSDDQPQASRHARELRDHLKDPDLRLFSLHVIALLGNLPASDVIAETRAMDSDADKLYLLRHWMVANRERADASLALEEGLKLALQATTYTATARDYRQLASCLPFLDDASERSKLLKLISAQEEVLRQVGPAEDFIRLQLLLGRALAQSTRSDGLERFYAAYNDLDTVEDSVVRLAGLARMSAALARVDPERELDQDLHSLVEDELANGIDDLLIQSAEHFEVSRGIIAAVAIPRPDTALAVIARLNTTWRRDLGYKHFVETAIVAAVSELPMSHICEALDRIEDPEIFDATMTRAALRLSGQEPTSELARKLERIFPYIEIISDLAARVRVGAAVVSWLCKGTDSPSETCRENLSRVWEWWDRMDEGWFKLEAGFTALTELADVEGFDVDSNIAKINELKAILSLPDAETTSAATLSVQLAIRAFAGMLRFNLEGFGDLERLRATIGKCGSVQDQAALISELAVRAYLADRPEVCKELAQKDLLPLVFSCDDEDPGYKYSVIRDSAPALYLGAPHGGKAQILQLPPSWRDDALESVAWVILTQVPPTDKFDHRPQTGYEIDFEDANAVVDIISEMRRDWSMYALVEAVVDSVIRSRSTISRAQRAELVRRLENIAARKFPAPGHISHDGYQIVALAQINRLRSNREQSPSSNFVRRAKDIPNRSDRAYVLAVIAATAREKNQRRELFEEAKSIVDTISILSDRLDRYEIISALARDIDLQWSRGVLKEALGLAREGEGRSVVHRRHSLLNAAYRIDPDFAASLAQVSDDDPAKATTSRQLQIFRIRDAIAQRRVPDSEIPEGTPDDYSKAAWLRLGLLNAGRIPATSARYVLPILQYAISRPVSEAYPIFAFFIENAVRYAQSERAVRTYVTPLFEACLRGAELAVLTADSRPPGPSRAPFLSHRTADGIIGGGELPRALEQIQSWLLEQQHESQFFLVDPYIRPGDMQILRLVQEAVEGARVVILTGPDAIEGLSSAPADAYHDAWRRFLATDPPETRFIVAQTAVSRKFPVHDRFWLSSDSGLALGTSLSGFGSRISQIRRLKKDEAIDLLRELQPFFSQQRREFEGERMRYVSFDL